jgi:hypothetical protein
MPIYLDEADISSAVDGCKSVLIVPCRFCPAASMAVRTGEPYFEPHRRFLKTASYERLINRVRQGLQERGVKTGVFRSRLLHQFVLCMWTSRRRRKLLKQAKGYEALVVMGCESAVQTVRDSVQPSSCRVIPGMMPRGVMGVKPSFHLPCNLRLELESVTPVVPPERLDDPGSGEDNRVTEQVAATRR